MVHPPSIDKVDSKLAPLINYDGYGRDIRPRISEIQKFNEKTKNPESLNIYENMRNQS